VGYGRAMLVKATAAVLALGFWKIPMLFAVRPRVLELDEMGCAIEIPLRRFTKNHFGTMYFGALAVGADLAAGLNAAWLIYSKYKGVNLVFKDFHADFLKRPDGDVVFRSTQGREIEAALAQAKASGERVTIPVTVVATVPSKHGDEPVARFTLGLSLK
jgi:acyl-coenzyme A thioesterase PaaI-like protein